jgi:hypothetical protein
MMQWHDHHLHDVERLEPVVEPPVSSLRLVLTSIAVIFIPLIAALYSLGVRISLPEMFHDLLSIFN